MAAKKKTKKKAAARRPGRPKISKEQMVSKSIYLPESQDAYLLARVERGDGRSISDILRDLVAREMKTCPLRARRKTKKKA